MKQNRNSKKGRGGLKRVLNALFYSRDGFLSAWIDEAAFRQVFILAIFCIFGTFFISSSWEDRMLLIIPPVLSVVVELINTAIENAIDFTSLKSHPLAKKAKDMGSTAQFVVLVFWVCVWGSFLWCKYVV
ncbi:diacylglycerol kinase [Helicobacter cappadocius]|uniref:Diacylglycerol kinase n=1 Tax=Helicobacter cappadocius TaxID=3063998 RepID=A0AA90PJF7_9HELI|nr:MULTISPECIES: diacylglycerol kinase [unclassified Helicobacter]MDO7253045.1 diacylglycerol kinase [Helicobacter sp. faydin-H75]MDP2538966.1 diacylglycerol kinase [Helicobacter sp. faydin-H76]